MSEHVIVTCPTCKKKMRVPGDKGKIRVTCPGCKGTFLFEGTSSAAQAAQTSVGSTTTTSRSQGNVQANSQSRPNADAQASRIWSNERDVQETAKSKPSMFSPSMRNAFDDAFRPKGKGNRQNSSDRSSQSRADVQHGASASSANAASATVDSASASSTSAGSASVDSASASSVTRYVVLGRFRHAHTSKDWTGLKNRMKDAANVPVYLDGVQRGVLTPDGDGLTLQIDGNEHSLSTSPFSRKHVLPAGSDGYIAFFFNDAFQIGIADDPFKEELIQFVLEMVRGRGFRDRIRDRANRNNCVDIKVQPEGLLLKFALVDGQYARDRKEKLFLEREEMIYYQQAGLHPTPEHRCPSGYWASLETEVQIAIENDPEADLEHVAGGYAERKVHDLY